MLKFFKKILSFFTKKKEVKDTFIDNGGRRTGKTTRMLIDADKNNGIVFVPTYQMERYAKDIAKRLELKKVKIIHLTEHSFRGIEIKKHNFYIDEYGLCKSVLGSDLMNIDDLKFFFTVNGVNHLKIINL